MADITLKHYTLYNKRANIESEILMLNKVQRPYLIYHAHKRRRSAHR